MSALDPFEEPPLEEPRQGGSAPPMGADWLLGGEEPPLVEEPAPDPPDYGVPEVQFTVQSNGLFSFGPMPGEELFSDPDPLDAPPGLGDGYAIETRAEAIKVFTLGDSVRRGDLDMVQIGDAAVTDMVTGSEITTISGKLREQTGGGLTYTAARVETTVEGRMSITSDMEDGILLGGAMTDTWIGGTFIAGGDERRSVRGRGRARHGAGGPVAEHFDGAGGAAGHGGIGRGLHRPVWDAVRARVRSRDARGEHGGIHGDGPIRRRRRGSVR